MHEYLIKIFGEMCIVANRKRIKAKLALQGKPCIWLGYAKSHKAGTYQVLNTTTNKVIITNNVVFLCKNYAEWIEGHTKTPKDLNSILSNVDSDNKSIEPIQQSNLVSDYEIINDEASEQQKDDPNLSFHTAADRNDITNMSFHTPGDLDTERLSGKLRKVDTPPNPIVLRALKQLEGSFCNPEATKIVREASKNQDANGTQQSKRTEAGRAESIHDLSELLCFLLMYSNLFGQGSNLK